MDDAKLTKGIEALLDPANYEDPRRLASMVYANGRLIIVIEDDP